MPAPHPPKSSQPNPKPPNEIVLELFIEHHTRVHAFVRSMVDPATADDITQETFFRLLKLRDLPTREISSSYLIKIAHNLVKRRARRAAMLDRLVEREAERQSQHAARSPAQRAAHAEPTPGRTADVAAELTALPSNHSEAVRLIVCEGLSYRAAASAMGVTVTTVNNWKHRGLTTLRQRETLAAPGRNAG
ncbi:MAG: RNA polymerase sigma factor [Planctomycetota bacterium]